VLVAIDAIPRSKHPTLARAIHLNRTSVISGIGKLETNKLFARRQADVDRRSNALWRTSDGKALLGKPTGLV
jgi:DNA-binding MarR family transcriptional regulator